ncbi:MAG TPA: hypothetical protein V6C86_12635 [Oculatellaceae cyanobacterium]
MVSRPATTVPSPAQNRTGLAPAESPQSGRREQELTRPQFDLYEQIFHPRLFRFWPCLIGILVGFLVCCVAGVVASRVNFYRDFHRFHEYISPATLYYPTVSQMVSIVESKAKPDQTIVIIGGNSIFNGIGQQLSDLWSDNLAQQLGDKYAVFNFAQPGALPFEGGYWTAESLLKRGKKVIFATVAVPTQAGTPDGEKIYGYMYWDARAKSMLLDSPKRDAAIERRLKISDESEQNRVAESKLCGQLDSLLHFRDLWSAVGYLKFFTVWTQPTAQNPFKPRYKYGDWQPYPVAVSKRFCSTEELNVVRGAANGFFEITPTTWKAKAEAWHNLGVEMNDLIPNHYKRNCLVIIAGHPPTYLNRLDEGSKGRVRESEQRSKQTWITAGYHCDDVGMQFQDEDYRDCLHLVASGGKKMATLVAANIRSVSKELHYDDGGDQ